MAALVPPAALAKVGVGDAFPAWSLTDLSGRSHQLGSDGTVTLLYFLGSGCSICSDISKQLDADFAKPFAADIVVYAIDSLDGSAEELGHLRSQSGAGFPFLRDGSALTAACGISWHALMVLDDQGTIRYLTEGANSGIYQPGALREAIDRLLGHVAETRAKTWGAIKQLYDGR